MSTLTSLPYIPLVLTKKYAAKEVLACSVILLTASWVTVALRYYTRIFIVRNTGWDDHLAFLATIFFTCFCVLVSVLSYRIVNKTEITPAHLTTATNVQFKSPFFTLGTDIF
jgi:hypothetical protein